MIQPENPGFKLSLVPLPTCTSAAHELLLRLQRGAEGLSLAGTMHFTEPQLSLASHAGGYYLLSHTSLWAAPVPFGAGIKAGTSCVVKPAQICECDNQNHT